MKLLHWLAVPIVTMMSAAALPAFQGSDAALPKAQEIVERYDHALGGRDAIVKHTSSTMRGTLEIHNAGNVFRLPFTYYAAQPYLRMEKVTLPNGAGDNLGGFDGTTAWGFDPRSGAEVQEGNDRESTKRDADFYCALDELTWFKSMETVAVEDFEGRPCYHLHGINNWDKSNDHYYDKETGLLTAYEFDSELGPTHEIFSDYKKIDGALFPMKQTVKVKSKTGEWEIRQVLIYDSVTFNDVEPAVFTPPQSVRDLAAKAKAPPAK
ncbi:MAG: hypothetical protein WBE76_17205 [Terracidiphilus sp.]